MKSAFKWVALTCAILAIIVASAVLGIKVAIYDISNACNRPDHWVILNDVKFECFPAAQTRVKSSIREV